MSLRAIGSRLFKHGTFIVRSLYKREFNTNKIAENIKPKRDAAVVPQQVTARNYGLRNVGLQVGLHARRVFVDSVLNRVTNSLAAELRRKAARRMLFGDSAPFFALVGVSLASGTGILTKDDELEGICLEIRETISKMKWNTANSDPDEEIFKTQNITLKDLDLGKPIAKGCSAVVYAARLINHGSKTDTKSPEKNENNQIETSVEITDNKTEISAEIFDSISEYPLAVKMMFNYDVQSSAMAILRAMYREIVPVRNFYSPIAIDDWQQDLHRHTINIPPHPNIVTMYSVFADQIPHIAGASGLYPAALPPRIYSEGAGRNMSLFLIMRRYHFTLRKYLQMAPKDDNFRKKLLILAQLLEGVAFINSLGVAHRDLKSDNVLVDLEEESSPLLVLTDFGCCLSDKKHLLTLPYNSYEIDKGGNTALMAPEVKTAQPGTFSVINYQKSDLWAVGAIAYEIFGAENPFDKLKGENYRESDLPEMPQGVPVVVKMLVRSLLARNPKKRPDVETAATVCQLLLWGPSAWLKANNKIPSSTELLQWLLCLTTKILCEGRGFSAIGNPGRRTYPEYLLISSFLRRVKLATIKNALVFIQNANNF